MYPGFRAGWQRALNAYFMRRALRQGAQALESLALTGEGETTGASPRKVLLTTLPITADLLASRRRNGLRDSGRLRIDASVYYCVDDFTVWPGIDHAVMGEMERKLLEEVDDVVCASDVLADRIRKLFVEVSVSMKGRVAKPRGEVLTHGVEVAHWAKAGESRPVGDAALTQWIDQRHDLRRRGIHTAMFWGLRDERLEHAWCAALGEAEALELAMAGPRTHAGPLEPGVGIDLGTLGFEVLPSWASGADVLVMPYVDAPVTRAMQPLKLLEYLATYKPVVVRDLPATREWADCCDVVSTPKSFVQMCQLRAAMGLPAEQRAARERRLAHESWAAKADVLEQVLQRAASAGR